METLSALDWLQIIGLGVACGTAGQLARVIVGLKKLSDEAAARSVALHDLVQGVRLGISVAIGGVAGALAALTVSLDPTSVTREHVLGLAAAGYAGADFVEGLMGRFLPSGGVEKGEAEGASKDGGPPTNDYLG